MTELTLAKAYALRESLLNDERILSLDDSEKKMEKDDEAMKLCYKKDLANDKYNEMVRLFKDDSEEVKNAKKELYLAKKEFESLEVVKDYLKKYQIVRLLYEDINNILFKDYEADLCPKKR